MSKTYQIVTRAAKESAAVIEQFCQANGQILLPIVNTIQSASEVVDSVIHEIGVKTLELILVLSAEQVAGPIICLRIFDRSLEPHLGCSLLCAPREKCVHRPQYHALRTAARDSACDAHCLETMVLH